MPMHLVSSRRLADELAADRVSVGEQSVYLAASFVIWGGFTYSFVVPPHATIDRFFFFGIWAYEFAVYVLIYLAGVPYCLRKCRVDPRRNFLIDFSCLYAPVSLTTLLIVWAAFYLYTQGILGVISSLSFEQPPPAAIRFLYDTRLLDILRAFAILGTSLVILLRIGSWLSYISDRREG